MANYYNGIGLLVSQKLIDVNLAQTMFAQYIGVFWKTYGPIIKGFREQYNLPRAWKWSEYLYNEMRKREQQPATQ